MSPEKKDKIKEYQKKKKQELVQYKKDALKNNFCFFLNIKNEWINIKIYYYSW